MEEWKIVIYMPAFNSGKLLPELLTRFRNVEKKLNSIGFKVKALLIVDDGSTDKTAELVKSFMEGTPYLRLLDKQKNEGSVAALFDGMKYIGKLIDDPEKTIVVRMDSDLEHQPEDLEGMIKPILSGKTKISVGYIPFDSRTGTSFKEFNESAGLEESRRFLGIDIPQFCPGFLAIRGDLFLEIHPLLIEKSEKFRHVYGEDLLSVDFVTLVLAKKLGQNPTVVKLSAIEEKHIKKQPGEKIETYLNYHRKTMEFLESEFKS